MTPTGYTVAAALVGAFLMAATLVGLYRIDETWRSHRWTCCRCRAVWIGTSKLCGRCGARGHTKPPVEVRTPAADWQGGCETGPIPIVPSPREPSHDQARHRLREEVNKRG